MLDKLAAIEEKFEQINAQLFDPEVISDIDKYKKERKKIKEFYHTYQDGTSCKVLADYFNL